MEGERGGSPESEQLSGDFINDGSYTQASPAGFESQMALYYQVNRGLEAEDSPYSPSLLHPRRRAEKRSSRVRSSPPIPLGSYAHMDVIDEDEWTEDDNHSEQASPTIPTKETKAGIAFKTSDSESDTTSHKTSKHLSDHPATSNTRNSHAVLRSYGFSDSATAPSDTTHTVKGRPTYPHPTTPTCVQRKAFYLGDDSSSDSD